MRKFYFIISIFVMIAAGFSTVSANKKIDKETEQVGLHADHVVAETGQHAVEHGHESGMEPLFFIIIALIIGAATRHFLKKSPLPFTVLLLLIGIGLGVLSRLGYFDVQWGFTKSFFSKSLDWAGNIDPHIILFVFLPTLIFEAAFAMDVHTFKKSVINAIILAVPGIIIALVLSAVMMVTMKMWGFGLNGWEWPMALMFGAVISATDPVAVVALLKELGASKKLGTLIEGESLLNDGTAIVIFMVFFTGITAGTASDIDIGAAIASFGYVSFGGILLGLVIGGVAMLWMKRVFNDALVEISVIVAAAYLTFFICEEFLHMSGVLGLVTLGLIMAGVGRTRISPEVEHFLHEFWEIAAFIANVLIFLIVGVVIAERTKFSSGDFLILGITYVGIHVIRAIVLFVLYPFMKNTGYGLPKKDAYVVWYGALRGAIGLALALIVANEPSIPIEIRNQFLFLTAGIVALTLLINATTIKFLVEGLGLTKVPAVKAAMTSNALQQLMGSTNGAMESLKEDRFMSGANWSSVRKYLPNPKMPEFDKDELDADDQVGEIRRRLLDSEKASYWGQFKDGLLGSGAVRKLSDGINSVLDGGGRLPLNEREYLDKLMGIPNSLNRAQKVPMIGGFVQRRLFDRLAMNYDLARGFVVAQEEMAKRVSGIIGERHLDDNASLVQELEGEINGNRISGLNYLKDLRENYPEVVNAIETRQAIRSVLNYEKGMIKQLNNQGRIEEDDAARMIASVEGRMKKLVDAPPKLKLPEPQELLKEVPWLQGLDQSVFEKVEKLVQNRLYAKGDVLVKAGEPGDGLFVIARGSVKVIVGQDFVVDVLGPGSVIGEMAVLAGGKRTATVYAETPVTALWMTSSGMQDLMKESDKLETSLWRTAGMRFVENLLGKRSPYRDWSEMKFRQWLNEGQVSLISNEIKNNDAGKTMVLIAGSATKSNDNTKITAPALLNSDENYSFSSDARVFVR